MIGESAIKNARRICIDPIENIEGYETAIADDKKYELHHRLETHDLIDGEWVERDVFIHANNLDKMNRYNNVPSSELIWLEKGKHRFLHNAGRNPKTGERTNKPIKHRPKNKPSNESVRKTNAQLALFDGEFKTVGQIKYILHKRGEVHWCSEATKYAIKQADNMDDPYEFI